MNSSSDGEIPLNSVLIMLRGLASVEGSWKSPLKSSIRYKEAQRSQEATLITNHILLCKAMDSENAFRKSL